ncbi:MAG: hypothetical protein U1D30_10245 [Planctomycetota bacterium]
MRSKIWLFGFATLFSYLPLGVQADERTDQYVEALRASGFADLAIEYLRNRWEAKGTTPEEKANLEFEIAASLIAASDALDDLSKREQMLEDARQKFEEFSKKHPKHPKAPEALVQMATVDLQKGRLRVVQAQLPANAGRAIALAKEAREFFKKSAADYEQAQTQLQAAFKAMPVYISDEDAEGRAQRAMKAKLFDQYIEARFQGALAQFYLADSYKTIEIPPADSTDAAAVAALKKEREEWDRAYKGALEKAKKGFEAIYTEHRRELVGLYAHLWMARCMAAQGEHRQAMGIYELLMEHENPDLARLQREVFYFQMISFAARKEYGQVVNLAVPWLRNNAKFRLEPAYQGVQMELALAFVNQATAAADEKEKSRDYVEANTLLERLGSYSNAYTGLARREQLKISPFLSKAIGGRSFSQLFSLANAKLDLLKPELPAEEQTKLLQESKTLLQDALRAVRESEDADAVNDARLALAFVHLRLEEIYEAATLCEYVARMHPKSTAAPQAAFFGITAYAWVSKSRPIWRKRAFRLTRGRRRSPRPTSQLPCPALALLQGSRRRARHRRPLGNVAQELRESDRRLRQGESQVRQIPRESGVVGGCFLGLVQDHQSRRERGSQGIGGSPGERHGSPLARFASAARGSWRRHGSANVSQRRHARRGVFRKRGRRQGFVGADPARRPFEGWIRRQRHRTPAAHRRIDDGTAMLRSAEQTQRSGWRHRTHLGPAGPGGNGQRHAGLHQSRRSVARADGPYQGDGGQLQIAPTRRLF